MAVSRWVTRKDQLLDEYLRGESKKKQVLLTESTIAMPVCCGSMEI
jgi:hypothetical protein